MGIPEEEIIPMDTCDHRTICRFPSRTNVGCSRLLSIIRNHALKIPKCMSICLALGGRYLYSNLATAKHISSLHLDSDLNIDREWLEDPLLCVNTYSTALPRKPDSSSARRIPV